MSMGLYVSVISLLKLGLISCLHEIGLGDGDVRCPTTLGISAR